MLILDNPFTNKKDFILKVVINFFALIGGSFVVLILIGLFSKTQSSNAQQKVDKSNYDGTYNIDYGNSKCGNYGYTFKTRYEGNFDNIQNGGKIHKSNCKAVNGKYLGYIYLSKKPHVRIFWEEIKGRKIVLLKKT